MRDNPIDKFNKLREHQQKQIGDLINFYYSQNSFGRKRKLKLDWFGGLREYRDKYTSLELQKKALEWWD